MSNISLYVCCVLLAMTASVLGGRHNQQLASFVLSDYDKRVFPDAVNVEMEINLQQIVDFDTETNVLTLDTWFFMYWTDVRLAWNNYGKFSDLSQLALPASSIWIPDIMLYNSADGYTTFNGDVDVIISQDGNVTFIPPVTFHSRCETGEDFDTTGIANCTLKFGSWTHQQDEVDLHARSSSFDVSSFNQGSGHWSYLGSSSVRNLITYACCPEAYVDVTYTVSIQRND